MFERYTEAARRTIFFARYEASVFVSPYIETEHMLLGLLREDRVLRDRLPAEAAEQIRKRIAERVPQPMRRGWSVDLPLSQDSKKALHHAAEESEALRHSVIDCGHLLLGILRIETSTAAVVLRDFGIEYAGYRDLVSDAPASSPPPASRESTAKLPLAKAALNLEILLATVRRLEEKSGQRLKRTGWTRKDALGHLIDWAATHQQWLASALTRPMLTANGHPDDSWLSAQQYNDLPWAELVNLCVSLNSLIAHVVARIPEEKMDTPCRVGVAEPIPLQELVRLYVAHCEDIVAQLLMRG
jgi:hypothetical protein